MKAQFEAMGLAIIVILVSLGFLLFIFFSSTGGTDFVDRYKNEQLAQDFVNAIQQMPVPVENCALNYKDLIEDVVSRNVNPCGNSQKLLDGMTQDIANMTLEQKGKRFKYIVQTTDNTGPVIISQYGDCPVGTKKAVTGAVGEDHLTFFPLGTKADIYLWICVKVLK